MQHSKLNESVGWDEILILRTSANYPWNFSHSFLSFLKIRFRSTRILIFVVLKEHNGSSEITTYYLIDHYALDSFESSRWFMKILSVKALLFFLETNNSWVWPWGNIFIRWKWSSQYDLLRVDFESKVCFTTQWNLKAILSWLRHTFCHIFYS